MNCAPKSAAQRFESCRYACLGLLLLECLGSVSAVSAAATLAPVTNTGLKNIHFKAVQCSEDGFWALDIVNNNFAPSYIEYFFWLEDDQGDAVEGDSGQVMLNAKSRESVQLTFGCEVPFTQLRPHFRWAPVGFTRP